MKKQSRIQSLFESATQTIVGLAIIIVLEIIFCKDIFILFTIGYFFASNFFQYFIRRFFNKCKNK